VLPLQLQHVRRARTQPVGLRPVSGEYTILYYTIHCVVRTAAATVSDSISTCCLFGSCCCGASAHFDLCQLRFGSLSRLHAFFILHLIFVLSVLSITAVTVHHVFVIQLIPSESASLSVLAPRFRCLADSSSLVRDVHGEAGGDSVLHDEGRQCEERLS
jgi:hypothetical protein